jgi:hypothetical protein
MYQKTTQKNGSGPSSAWTYPVSIDEDAAEKAMYVLVGRPI